MAVFAILDRAEIPHCVLHSYEDYPERIKSDVDGIISAKLPPSQLLALLHKNGARIGADVVRCEGYHFVLAGKNADGSPCFLDLDMSADYELDGRPLYAGHEVLATRRRYRQFWVPAAKLEFGCYLVKKIAKGHLAGEHALRLSSLFAQDAAGCEEQVIRFWSAGGTALILSAAGSGDWEPVRCRLRALGAELRWRATLRNPGRVVVNRFHRLASLMGRCWRRDGGLSVVLLGPDGAGKSSVIRTVGPMLIGAFRRTTYCRFTPALVHRLLHRPIPPNGQPHALPPRSFLMSTVRALLYWFVYYALGYITSHLALARSTLVLHDRHLVDALVDPMRHRYGGPLWLLRLIARLIPKPDLIILLDAPAGVLQARKQEVSFEESARQRKAYLSLMATMTNGEVVDAARPIEDVVGDVNEMILRVLATRIARRHRLEDGQAIQSVTGLHRAQLAGLAQAAGPTDQINRIGKNGHGRMRSAFGNPQNDNRRHAPVATMPKPNAFRRVVARMIRDIKRIFGVTSYLRNEDRRILEQIILPHFLNQDSYRDILFVGCHWYTEGYNGRFEKKKNYWTIEIEPSRQKYGAKQHVVDGLQSLGKHFKPGAFDLILCNGVFGWGLDEKADVEQAFQACSDCLREGGVLLIGWDDIEERRPFLLAECQSLRALEPFAFPPLGTAEYVTDTTYRHTYTFYIKR
jgi:thymidylate kinase